MPRIGENIVGDPFKEFQRRHVTTFSVFQNVLDYLFLLCAALLLLGVAVALAQNGLASLISQPNTSGVLAPDVVVRPALTVSHTVALEGLATELEYTD